ncbi:MAG: ferric iron uptake transcriptional regulator [Thiotrichales bacterium]|jgi:Fur family ferric uptake transcriptional regulator|nr:ferric iron uptake transcriptional regulator [Thiotrichales bacterium]MBT3613320.1 ferric iron uptake transcriptional regulator [Thiotrichales bacterium]MBT3752435.1 ferric iron uptake transcriptional regulator [Thiotrichales bacterium]MBT3836977.1 ferric iron uptake transcriptional regulator [Thiotrichales bacterium]MBT4152734.1 ferric iron uptake transcriptional regulator [Thiotrichales bacterium]
MSKSELSDRAQLKGAGLKITLPRMKILSLLENSKVAHVSAEDVYRKLIDDQDDIGLATVYRVLTQFEIAGLVERHNFDTGHSVFELNKGDHHDHLLCTKCGKVQEFINAEIEKNQEKVAKKYGFEITDHTLVIYGKCDSCK